MLEELGYPLKFGGKATLPSITERIFTRYYEKMEIKIE